MECSYCTKPAILISGKNYCEEHIGYYDVRFFTEAVIQMFKREREAEGFFVWAFGNKYPKCSDLCEWHSRIPREENKKGKWMVHGIYKEDQDSYIRRIAQVYLSIGKEESHGITERGLTQGSVASAV